MQNKTYTLFKDISLLKGVGIKTRESFYKAGITRIVDLLLHLPRKIDKKPVIESVLNYDFEAQNEVIIKLKVVSYNIGKITKGKKPVYKIACTDSKNNKVELFFINYYKTEYLEKNYPLQQKLYVSGKISVFKGSYTISHPTLIGESVSDESTNEIVYPSINGVSSKVIKKLIKQSLDYIKNTELEEWHNKSFIKTHKLPSFIKSIKHIHSCTENEDLDREKSLYIKRLSADEMLSYNISIAKKMLKYKKHEGISFKNNNKVLIKQLLKSLPFTLTQEQIKAIKNIFKQMDLNLQANELLQGDVGSGKTIVSFFCALKAIEHSYQVALIAPTTVLAKQHYINALELLKPLNVNVGLLISQNTKKEKQNTIQGLKDQTINLIIGTHSLIEDNIEIPKLGLVIIDEQHKFGVIQRQNLVKKGLKPDIISMSATPIPRTLALSIKNFVNVTTIASKPQNRKEIKTSVLNIKNIDKILEKLKQQLKNNAKVFWVCPLVEESEKIDLMAVNERHEILKEYFAEFKEDVYLVHGKMKEIEKETAINAFKKAKRGILVSTTVIEVGVDIPSSNIMIIEEANRFGLSQLHQIRGRVGRGKEQGYCILLYKDNIGKHAKARIKALKEHSDGFELANIDFLLRGYGDLIGTNQTGLINFKITDLEKNTDLFQQLVGEANVIYANKNPKQQTAVEVLLNIFKLHSNLYT